MPASLGYKSLDKLHEFPLYSHPVEKHVFKLDLRQTQSHGSVPERSILKDREAKNKRPLDKTELMNCCK